jgi:putative MFS transporter
VRAVSLRHGEFRHPVAFWPGVVACAASAALHIPSYYGARDMGYRMAGMRPDPAMLIGMALLSAAASADISNPRDAAR